MAHTDSTTERRCQCGCNSTLSAEPRFIKGHNARLGAATPNSRGKVLDPRAGPNPTGLCLCGCGNPAPISVDNKHGRIMGCYTKFIRGHSKRRTPLIGNPGGACMCGCGETTPIARQTRLGNIAGTPQMFCPGHRQRTTHTINAETGCWVLKVHRPDGYTRIRRNGTLYLGHVWYWQERHGRVVKTGYELDHTCRNRACVNPDHLEEVTHEENMWRTMWKEAIPHWDAKVTIAPEPVTGCWPFPVVQNDGYARVWKNGYLLMAHTLFYERAHGPVPVGMELDHTCNRKACVNPSHLEPVLHEENMRRAMVRKIAAMARQS